MLSLKLRDINGRIYDKVTPLSMVLQKDENVPAHSLDVYVDSADFPEIVYIELLSDGIVLFEGDVDEQVLELSKSPSTFLSARSTASRLMDNEACPMTFTDPCTEDIFQRYAKPFGFNSYIGDNKVCQGRFTVSKGTSCYSVLKSFCQRVYGALPCAEGDTLRFDRDDSEDTVNLPNKDIRKARLKTLRFKRISDVFVKTQGGRSYDSKVQNTAANNAGITRVRYLNASPSGADTLSDAYEIIRKSEQQSVLCEVEIDGFFPLYLGKKVVWDLPYEELYVASVKCSLSSSGYTTKLTLKRREI